MGHRLNHFWANLIRWVLRCMTSSSFQAKSISLQAQLEVNISHRSLSGVTTPSGYCGWLLFVRTAIEHVIISWNMFHRNLQITFVTFLLHHFTDTSILTDCRLNALDSLDSLDSHLGTRTLRSNGRSWRPKSHLVGEWLEPKWLGVYGWCLWLL